MTKDITKSDFDLTGDLSTEGSIGDGTFGLSCIDIDDVDDLLSVKENNNDNKLIIHKQLLHDLQVLKIESDQKDTLLNNLKYEYTIKCENLEEKLQDALHQNHILNTKLNNIIEINRYEKERNQEVVKKEIANILLKQKELEEINKKYFKNENDIKKDLRNLDLNQEEYQSLCKRDEDMLTLKEYILLKFHKTQTNLNARIDELVKQNKYLDEAYTSKRNEFEQLNKNYEEDKRRLQQTTTEHQKMYFELADTKALLQQANFKKDNYDKTKYERDEYERKYNECETSIITLNTNILSITKERNDLIKEISELRQEVKLLKQDKDYLNKQLNDYQNKYELYEVKLEQTTNQLEDMKKSREEVYEKYVSSKEIYKNDYESKLTQELEKFQTKATFEFDKLRANTHEFYERENRALKESRDLALKDKEKAELNERQLNKKCNELLNELRLIQINNDNKLNDLKSELKLKLFELDRSNLLNEEITNNLKKTLFDNEKLTKKIEVIQNEYYALQINNDKHTIELESKLNEFKNKLEAYEKLEHEIDNVLVRVVDEHHRHNDGHLYHFNDVNLVTSAKKRLQQNAHLTKRALNLEKLNTSLRHELDREREHVKQLNSELQSNKNIFEQMNQPQEYLIHTIQAKEIQIKKLNNSLELLTKKYDDIQIEKERLVEKQNEMSNDIERLLRNNEELNEIRQELREKASIIGIQKSTSSFPIKLINKNAVISDSLKNNQPEPLLYTQNKEIKYPPPRIPLSSEKTKTRPYTIDKST